MPWDGTDEPMVCTRCHHRREAHEMVVEGEEILCPECHEAEGEQDRGKEILAALEDVKG